jgi:hypothetical protein
MVCQCTIEAEAFGHAFVMVVLVLQFFHSGEVHSGRAIIAIVSAGRVAHHVGSRWGCLGSGWVGIIGVARVVGIGSDLVVEFYT